MFSLPDDLAPECYPLAWLLGRWRGFGVLGYPDVPESPFVQDVVFDHDGGPYLRSTSTIYLADPEASAPVAREMTGREGAENLVPGQLWSTETSYWRPAPGGRAAAGDDASHDDASHDDASHDDASHDGASHDGAPHDGAPHDGAPGRSARPASTARTAAGAPAPGPTDLEVLVADPSGHVSVYVGHVQGPRIELATDAVVRTASAAEVTGARRMYGLVQSDLLWALDLAAFGHELQSYASGRLTRVEDEAEAGEDTGSTDDRDDAREGSEEGR